MQGVLLHLRPGRAAAVQLAADGQPVPASPSAPNTSAASGTHWLDATGGLLLALSGGAPVTATEVLATSATMRVEGAASQGLPQQLAAVLQVLPQQLVLSRSAADGCARALRRIGAAALLPPPPARLHST